MLTALVLALAVGAIDDAPRAASLTQLNADYAALSSARPNVIGPAVSAGVGVGLVALGGLSFALGYALRASLFFVFMIIGPAVAAVGLVAGVIGGWLLLARLPERRRVDQELRRLKLEIAEAQRRQPVPPMTIVPPVGL
jgi:hypothetical protein